jgi:hypothetical protein
MTQAMNLANFSNYLDASGQVAPTVLNAPVPISKGGTGATTAAAARAALDVPQAVYAVPSGGIIMWSGSIATIPTGWLLCNGSSGTPDLRNKFMIGAYVDSGGIANTTITGSNTQTGGSKDAIIVSHTHTASVTDPGHIHGTAGNNQLGAGAGRFSAGGYPIDVMLSPINMPSAVTGITVSNSTIGSSGIDANLVPYYALAFIMKS